MSLLLLILPPFECPVATLGSFVIAFLYMALELAVYQTIDLRGATSPMIVAGVSIVWMGLGYSTYLA